MAMALVGWIRSRGSQRDQIDLETCRAGLEDIGSRLKRGVLSEAEADVARLALLSPLTSSGAIGTRDAAGPSASAIIVPAAIFLLVAGIGAAATYTESTSEAAGTVKTASAASQGDDETLARLKAYTQSFGSEKPAPTATAGTTTPAGKMLPDVNVMIDRLAARLETEPGDIAGWRTLGWSYFHTERFEQAAAAFAKAVELDPSSTELKQSYDEAKAKASGGSNLETASVPQADAGGKGGDGASSGASATSGSMPSRGSDATIRSMVDGLARRLESSPQDAEGWTRLMRSRVVLGETEAASTALQKATEIFKDDAAASEQIKAAAIELGLKVE